MIFFSESNPQYLHHNPINGVELEDQGGRGHYSDMNFNFESRINRRGTSCYKWDFDKRLTGREGLLSFWVADMDFRVAPVIEEALESRLAHGIFGYTARPESLDAALVNWFSHRHAWKIEESGILETPGIVPFIHMFVREFSNPGDSVIIQEPVYYPFRKALVNNGRKVAVNQLVHDNDGCWAMDLDDLSRIIDETDAKILIFCSPHNPVGRVWREDELLNLADLCRDRGVTVVSDEIHADLIHPGYHHIPWLSLPEERRPRSLALVSPTKTFNIPGLTTAYAIIPDPDLYRSCQNMLTALGLGEGCFSPLSYAAAEAGWREGESWLEALLAHLGKNDTLLRQRLGESLPDMRIAALEGTYLEWLHPGIPDPDDVIWKSL
ncbi:MAG: PatB family C-S lyase, partial [Spirochaetaceae bacterium]|nr:PatB family C-S lyase [Spirochaetaceae bacterium]